MKSLHLCYISQEYPPETGWGGIGSYTYEMAHGLAAIGHRVTVISRAVNEEISTAENGITIHRLQPKPNWDRLPIAWRMNWIWPGFAWAAMLKMREVHRQTPIDVIEAAEGRADSFFISYMPRRPKLITRLHTARIFIDQFNGLGDRRGARQDYWLEKQSICRADLVTAPSKAVLNLTQGWLKLNEAKTFVVPNPISTANFPAANGNRAQMVLYVGRLERNKGAETMMKALPILLKQFPNLEFSFIGADGADRDQVSWSDKILQSVEPANRVRVKFETSARDELVSAYRRAAVCVLPSKWENAPYAALEAMACGTPVVACDAGGTPELIQDGISGFLVPFDDMNALADRVGALLTQPAMRKTMGENARRRIEQSFSTERVLPQMLAAYNHLLAQA